MNQLNQRKVWNTRSALWAVLLTSAATSVLLFVTGSCNSSINSALERPENVERYQPEDEEEFEQLVMQTWEDRSLSRNNTHACDTCHYNLEGFQRTFEQDYPHFVVLAEQEVTLQQMIQVCYIKSMGNRKPLAWDSKEMAALVARVRGLQSEYRAKINQD